MITEKRTEAEVRGIDALNRVRAENDVNELEKLARDFNRKLGHRMGQQLGNIQSWQRAPEYMQDDIRIREQRKLEQAFERIIPRNTQETDSFVGEVVEQVSLLLNEPAKNNKVGAVITESKKDASILPDNQLDISSTDTLTDTSVTRNDLPEFREPLSQSRLNNIIKEAKVSRETALAQAKDLDLTISSTSSRSSRKIAKLKPVELDETLKSDDFQVFEPDSELMKSVIAPKSVSETVSEETSEKPKTPPRPILAQTENSSLVPTSILELSESGDRTSSDLESSLKTDESMQTVDQFESVLNQVRKQKKIHLDFIKEIEMQRLKLQKEIDDIREVNNNTREEVEKRMEKEVLNLSLISEKLGKLKV